MRAVLLSLATANELEYFGFWILIGGLAGELVTLFIPPARAQLLKILTAICVVAIIFGIWLERVGTDANKAPRRLNAEQQVRVIAATKSFVVPFIVLVANAAEPLDLALDISGALKTAGWEWRDATGLGIGLTGRPAIGFSILAHVEINVADPKFKAAGDALAQSLRAIGLEDVREPVASTAPANPSESAIYVIVGTKK